MDGTNSDDNGRDPVQHDDAEPRDVAAPQPRAVTPRKDVDFGVVVGVEHYPHLSPLPGAIADAIRFHDWLREREGGGLDAGHIKLITSELETRRPVKEEIDEALDWALESAFKCNGARRLYFYFAGHGASNELSGDDVALLLTRWSMRLARTALSTHGYSSTLRGVGLFQELVVFVDCCRSTSVSAIGMPPNITRGTAEQPTCSFVAYATEAGRSAFECADSGEWHGIFTACLLAILRRSPSGVSARALKDLLEREVDTEARRRGVHQRAQCDNGLPATSYFGHGGHVPMLELKLGKRRGSVALQNGDLHEVARTDANGEPWLLSLPVGLYRLHGGGADPVCFEHDGKQVSREL